MALLDHKAPCVVKRAGIVLARPSVIALKTQTKMTRLQTLIGILTTAMLATAWLHAEDITTLTGAVYKNATISRAEPDGIVVVHSAGIVKIPFTELSDDYKKRFNYNEAAATQFSQADAKNQ